jgi:hypothetical protein
MVVGDSRLQSDTCGRRTASDIQAESQPHWEIGVILRRSHSTWVHPYFPRAPRSRLPSEHRSVFVATDKNYCLTLYTDTGCTLKSQFGVGFFRHSGLPKDELFTITCDAL